MPGGRPTIAEPEPVVLADTELLARLSGPWATPPVCASWN